MLSESLHKISSGPRNSVCVVSVLRKAVHAIVSGPFTLLKFAQELQYLLRARLHTSPQAYLFFLLNNHATSLLTVTLFQDRLLQYF